MEDHPELMPLLTVAGGPTRGVNFRVSYRPQVIGRGPSADISVADPHLSRRHASVTLTDQGVVLMDLGSTNGTWLNDHRIGGPQYLTDGDVIRIGRTDLRFFDPGLARTDPVGLRFSAPRTDHHRPTVPLPIATPPAGRPAVESYAGEPLALPGSR
ncbi:FHA domain-containing protein [Micromonospora mangrovi]|uniref:FHA domain-containing protein n=2 Tax=Micromonospora TaxID=1873 RepID=A0AAU7M8E5_9ACTN